MGGLVVAFICVVVVGGVIVSVVGTQLGRCICTGAVVPVAHVAAAGVLVIDAGAERDVAVACSVDRVHVVAVSVTDDRVVAVSCDVVSRHEFLYSIGIVSSVGVGGDVGAYVTLVFGRNGFHLKI